MRRVSRFSQAAELHRAPATVRHPQLPSDRSDLLVELVRTIPAALAGR